MSVTIEGYLDFICNCCGTRQHTNMHAVLREGASCYGCGSSVRMRSIVHHISMAMFQRPLALPDFPISKRIRGLGMSDWEGYSEGFDRAFSYTNTFFHQEPFLDIGQPLPEAYRGQFDFVVCTEVLEHVAPPVGPAFDNLFALLKPAGFLVLTVPYAHRPQTKEHFPDMLTGKLVEVDGSWGFVYRHRSGELVLANDLIFHGGPGSTLEMREFALVDVVKHIERVGFCEIQVHDGEYLPFGIAHHHDTGLPMTAWKPGGA